MKKHNIICLMLMLFLSILIPAKSVQAKEPVKFDTDSLTFTSREQESSGDNYFWNGGSGPASDNHEDIVKVKSTDEKVAWANFEPFSMTINPVGVGTCDIIATDAKNNTATIHVTVKPSYISSNLKLTTSLDNTWYGSKKIVVWSEPGATGKLTIGKKTYKFTIPKSSDGTPMKKTVKLSKVYKLNTKIKCTVTVKSNGTKVSAKISDKFGPGSWVMGAKGKKKNLTLTIFNLHKGDVVKVKYKGKTYTKKIRKDKDNKNSKVTFKLKKKLTKNALFTVTINNKDKKKLDKEKLTLTNWKYEYVEDEGYSEDESVSE